MSGGASYAYDDDGNVASIVGTGGSQYFTFDSANRLVCIDTVEGGCAVSRIHYDVDGRRVLDDKPGLTSYRAYIDDGVNADRSFSSTVHIEVHAFGERIAYKNSTGDFRQAVVVPFNLPPEVLHFLLGVGLLGLLGWLARRGALVLVLERPAQAGLAATLVVTLVFLPVPVNDANAGGGGSSTFYWELADRLGTGMVMLDETGARVVHRTYSPFGAEHASAGAGGWLPSHYAGHRKDEDSGLVYMQARWMDPEAGTFLSVDPLVGSVFDPQSVNAYAYARNNPVSATDPTGQAWYFADSYIAANGSLVSVYTNSSQAAEAVWLPPFEAPSMPSFSNGGGLSGLGAPSLGDIGGPSLAGVGALGGALPGSTPPNQPGGQPAKPEQPSGSPADLASDVLGGAALVSEGTGQLADQFLSTQKYAGPFKALAKTVFAPAAIGTELVRAGQHAQKGEGGEAVARTADAVIGGVLTYSSVFGGPASLALSAGYFSIGGFDGVLYGTGILVEAVIEAGPNGPGR